MANQYPKGQGPLCPRCQTNTIKMRGAKLCRECAYDVMRDPQRAARAPITSYDEAYDTLDALIGRTTARYRGPAERAKRKWQKILVASDFHHPFSDAETIGQLFAREKDADVCLLDGDLIDSFAISRFVKYETVAFETELAALVAFLERASQTWPKVILVEGNHDRARFEKQLRTRLDDHMVDVILFLSGGNLSVLRAVASRYPNVAVTQMPVGRYRVDWIHVQGDAVVTHAEKFSIVPGGALRKVEDWLLDQELNLRLPDWRVVIQAHTHGLAWFPFHADKLLVESGCCCDLMGYQFTARIGGRPQRNGWVTLEQKDGKTDRDSVRCRWPERQEQAA